jgi:hypothetical protein
MSEMPELKLTKARRETLEHCPVMALAIASVYDEFGLSLDQAQAALSALDAAGYAVVPKEPTEEMLEAGSRAINALQGSKEDDHPLHHPAQNSWDEPSMKWWQQWNETAEEAYRSMLSTAQVKP